MLWRELEPASVHGAFSLEQRSSRESWELCAGLKPRALEFGHFAERMINGKASTSSTSRFIHNVCCASEP